MIATTIDQAARATATSPNSLSSLAILPPAFRLLETPMYRVALRHQEGAAVVGPREARLVRMAGTTQTATVGAVSRRPPLMSAPFLNTKTRVVRSAHWVSETVLTGFSTRMTCLMTKKQICQ